MGDNTPQYSGFLTLNPLAHIDVIGVLVFSCMFSFFIMLERGGNTFIGIILILLIILIGVRPYHPVHVNSDNFRSYKWGVTVTTLIGPFSYFLLTLLSMYALVYGFYFLGPQSSGYGVIKQIGGSIVEWALFWGVIGLIPVPPFDASALLPVLFGQVGQDLYDLLEQYALFIFLGLFFIPGVSNGFIHLLYIMRSAIYKGLMMLVF